MINSSWVSLGLCNLLLHDTIIKSKKSIAGTIIKWIFGHSGFLLYMLKTRYLVVNVGDFIFSDSFHEWKLGEDQSLVVVFNISHNNKNEHLTRPWEGSGLNAWVSTYHYLVVLINNYCYGKSQVRITRDFLFVDLHMVLNSLTSRFLLVSCRYL